MNRVEHTGEELWTAQLGRLGYDAAVTLQAAIRAARQRELIPDALLLLEHDPVYTRGKRATAAGLPMGVDWYRSQGFEVRDTDRGGQVTYHGPGQLVGYPIVAVVDVVAYVRSLERAMIAALIEEGVAAGTRKGLTGVWIGDRKIGSIGVHVQRGVTTHGFSVNVQGDLQPWEWVVPCGIEGVRMTSIARETGNHDRLGCFRKRMAHRLAEELGLRQRLVSLERLMPTDRGFDEAGVAMALGSTVP